MSDKEFKEYARLLFLFFRKFDTNREIDHCFIIGDGNNISIYAPSEPQLSFYVLASLCRTMRSFETFPAHSRENFLNHLCETKSQIERFLIENPLTIH